MCPIEVPFYGGVPTSMLTMAINNEITYSMPKQYSEQYPKTRGPVHEICTLGGGQGGGVLSLARALLQSRTPWGMSVPAS